MSAVCIPFTPAPHTLPVGRSFTICYLDPETKKQEEELVKSFSSRYEAFTWAWDYANGRIFTVRPSSGIPA